MQESWYIGNRTCEEERVDGLFGHFVGRLLGRGVLDVLFGKIFRGAQLKSGGDAGLGSKFYKRPQEWDWPCRVSNQVDRWMAQEEWIMTSQSRNEAD